MAKKLIECLLERQDNKSGSQGQNQRNSIASTLGDQEDYADLVTCCEWTTSTFHSKLYTGRFKASRGDLVGQGQTGEE